MAPVGEQDGIGLVRLKKRPEFLRAARGRKRHTVAFTLQRVPRPDPEGDGGTAVAGVGFTASKKVGNAVSRNRAKRRLREAARAVMPTAARPGFDHVLVARTELLDLPYSTLLGDLRRALAEIERAPPAGDKRRGKRGGGQGRSA